MIKKYIWAAVWTLMCGITLVSCRGDGGFDYDHVGYFITDTENDPLVLFTVEDTPSTYTVTVQSTQKVDDDVTFSLAIDPTQVDEYNAKHGTNYQAMPQHCVRLLGDRVTIGAQQAVSTGAEVQVVSTEGLTEGRIYVIPVTVTRVGGTGGEVLPGSRTIFLRLSRIINFYAIQANAGASSNFIFDEAIHLSKLTYEMKIYPQGLNRTNYPQRFLALEEADESKSLLLRFNEANAENRLQVLLAGNRFLSNTQFENGQWYLLSIVYDGSTISLYVNGELDTSIAGTIDGGGLDFQRYEMGMSWGSYNTRQFFAHRFCELRIWDRPLSATEIKQGLGVVDPQSEGLCAYWKFDEGEGYIFHDATGHGRDMDWSKTSRAIYEGDMIATPNAANYIHWVKDDINKYAQ